MIVNSIKQAIQSFSNGLNILFGHATLHKKVRDGSFTGVCETWKFKVPEQKTNPQQQLLELAFVEVDLCGQPWDLQIQPFKEPIQ